MGLKSEKSPATGRTYCFRPKTLILSPESRKAMLNQYFYRMAHAPIGHKGEIFVALADLVRIFSPDWQLETDCDVDCAGRRLHFTPDFIRMERDDEIIVLKQAPFRKEEQLYVPFSELMGQVLGCYLFRMGSYIGASACEEDSKILFDGPGSQPFTARRLDFRYKKNYGDLYFTIWLEEERRLNNYRMYVPFSYDGSRPYKMIVCLHGGNGDSDTPFIRSGQKLQYYAEKYGYILLAPNSYVHGSNYGSQIPPYHMFPEPETPGEKPEFYTAEEEKEFQTAQKALRQVLDEVLCRWNIDRGHIFVMGNSMGSCGTFHLISTWPELFRGGAPSACMPLMEYVETEKLKGKPLLFLTGTEDANDPEWMLRCCRYLQDRGVDIRMQVIGGGYHPDAWVKELEAIFEFFENMDGK